MKNLFPKNVKCPKCGQQIQVDPTQIGRQSKLGSTDRFYFICSPCNVEIDINTTSRVLVLTTVPPQESSVSHKFRAGRSFLPKSAIVYQSRLLWSLIFCQRPSVHGMKNIMRHTFPEIQNFGDWWGSGYNVKVTRLMRCEGFRNEGTAWVKTKILQLEGLF